MTNQQNANVLRSVHDFIQGLSRRYSAFATDRSVVALEQDRLLYSYKYGDVNLRCEIFVHEEHGGRNPTLHVKCIDGLTERVYEWDGMEESVTKLLIAFVDGGFDNFAVKQMLISQKSM